MADQAQPQPSPEQQNQPSFQIEKVYVKDLSLEIPHAPQVFVERRSRSLKSRSRPARRSSPRAITNAR